MRFGVAGNGMPHRPGKVAVLDFAYRTPPLWRSFSKYFATKYFHSIKTKLGGRLEHLLEYQTQITETKSIFKWMIYGQY